MADKTRRENAQLNNPAAAHRVIHSWLADAEALLEHRRATHPVTPTDPIASACELARVEGRLEATRGLARAVLVELGEGETQGREDLAL